MGKEETKTFRFSKEGAITILSAFAFHFHNYGKNMRQDEIAKELLEKYPEIKRMDA